MTTAWDPANSGGRFGFSGGNLIVTHFANDTAGWQLAIADTGRSTGKRYFEILLGPLPNDGVVNGGYYQIGFAQNNQTANGFIGQSGDDGWTRADMATFDGGGDGIVTYATANRGYTTAVAGDVIAFAVGFAAGKVWVAKNNSYGGDPVAGTNPAWTWASAGTWYPCHASFTTGSTNNVLATLHADVANQTYSPPSGYTDWDGGTPGTFTWFQMDQSDRELHVLARKREIIGY